MLNDTKCKINMQVHTGAFQGPEADGNEVSRGGMEGRGGSVSGFEL